MSAAIHCWRTIFASASARLARTTCCFNRCEKFSAIKKTAPFSPRTCAPDARNTQAKLKQPTQKSKTNENRIMAKRISARTATVRRQTKETDIRASLNLDGRGRSNISTGLPFLDHMLDLFARHGLFDLDLTCAGDLEIDDHHSVEDIAILLGQA